MKLVPTRLAVVFRYLSNASAPYKWRISGADCPLCGRSVFLSLRPDPFMTRCLNCRATVTNLSLIPVIAEHFSGKFVGKRAYELSTYGSTLTWLNSRFAEVLTSEFYPDAALGEIVGGVVNQDVQALTFDSDSLDLVSSNQVFEHVPDDLRGFKECFRVLKSGGALVLTVPLHDIPRTRQIARLEGGTIVFFGTPEYHDSRTTGAGTVPVFWHHSEHDIAERVRGAGFSSVRLVDVIISRGQTKPARVVYAVK